MNSCLLVILGGTILTCLVSIAFCSLPIPRTGDTDFFMRLKHWPLEYYEDPTLYTQNVKATRSLSEWLYIGNSLEIFESKFFGSFLPHILDGGHEIMVVGRNNFDTALLKAFPWKNVLKSNNVSFESWYQFLLFFINRQKCPYAITLKRASIDDSKLRNKKGARGKMQRSTARSTNEAEKLDDSFTYISNIYIFGSYANIEANHLSKFQFNFIKFTAVTARSDSSKLSFGGNIPDNYLANNIKRSKLWNLQVGSRQGKPITIGHGVPPYYLINLAMMLDVSCFNDGVYFSINSDDMLPTIYTAEITFFEYLISPEAMPRLMGLMINIFMETDSPLFTSTINVTLTTGPNLSNPIFKIMSGEKFDHRTLESIFNELMEHETTTIKISETVSQNGPIYSEPQQSKPCFLYAKENDVIKEFAQLNLGNDPSALLLPILCKLSHQTKLLFIRNAVSTPKLRNIIHTNKMIETDKWVSLGSLKSHSDPWRFRSVEEVMLDKNVELLFKFVTCPDDVGKLRWKLDSSVMNTQFSQHINDKPHLATLPALFHLRPMGQKIDINDSGFQFIIDCYVSVGKSSEGNGGDDENNDSDSDSDILSPDTVISQNNELILWNLRCGNHTTKELHHIASNMTYEQVITCSSLFDWKSPEYRLEVYQDKSSSQIMSLISHFKERNNIVSIVMVPNGLRAMLQIVTNPTIDVTAFNTYIIFGLDFRASTFPLSKCISPGKSQTTNESNGWKDWKAFEFTSNSDLANFFYSNPRNSPHDRIDQKPVENRSEYHGIVFTKDLTLGNLSNHSRQVWIGTEIANGRTLTLHLQCVEEIMIIRDLVPSIVHEATVEKSFSINHVILEMINDKLRHSLFISVIVAPKVDITVLELKKDVFMYMQKVFRSLELTNVAEGTSVEKLCATVGEFKDDSGDKSMKGTERSTLCLPKTKHSKSPNEKKNRNPSNCPFNVYDEFFSAIFQIHQDANASNKMRPKPISMAFSIKTEPDFSGKRYMVKEYKGKLERDEVSFNTLEILHSIQLHISSRMKDSSFRADGEEEFNFYDQKSTDSGKSHITKTIVKATTNWSKCINLWLYAVFLRLESPCLFESISSIIFLSSKGLSSVVVSGAEELCIRRLRASLERAPSMSNQTVFNWFPNQVPDRQGRIH